MNKEIICIDSSFAPDVIEFYNRHGIVTPLTDVLYSVRGINKGSGGKWEVLLQEIVNKEVPIKHFGGVQMKEPAWDLLRRFRNLDGTDITIAEIKELIEEEKGVLERVEKPYKANEFEKL